ncbi:MAG: hypothetical protein E6J90_27270 [Deltaproteobacteria bacterium]|nr:MAG: hypothetical protein E6J91_38020 [Deltaproteobacteria bacterium]TMQ14154.1 MAG: hypothetical protein E6J90_27270 [Deltaproteobacteria bacterium]
MQRLLVVWSVVLCACSGTPAPAPDAGNGTFGAACTMVSDTSTECASGVCTGSIDMIGHPVCSVKCTYGMDATCPSGSMGMKCNMKGYCKP